MVQLHLLDSHSICIFVRLWSNIAAELKLKSYVKYISSWIIHTPYDPIFGWNKLFGFIRFCFLMVWYGSNLLQRCDCVRSKRIYINPIVARVDEAPSVRSLKFWRFYSQAYQHHRPFSRNFGWNWSRPDTFSSMMMTKQLRLCIFVAQIQHHSHVLHSNIGI